MTACNWWLMKSEPDVYGITHLSKEKATLWDGIRNYQARNFMRSMKTGDISFFYHSNCKSPGIAGLMEIVQTHLVDPTQFDRDSKYFDPKSTKEKPRWDCVKVSFLKKFNYNLSLKQLKDIYNEDQLQILRKGNRLSITPVDKEIAENILNLVN
tara:strand:- start:197 stop:658 length:462 start_codon:yes stop_codon:yes gene_type:complete